MEGCGPKDAAERLSGWYGVGKKETPQRMVEGSSATEHQKVNPDSSTSTDIRPSDGEGLRQKASAGSAARLLG